MKTKNFIAPKLLEQDVKTNDVVIEELQHDLSVIYAKSEKKASIEFDGSKNLYFTFL